MVVPSSSSPSCIRGRRIPQLPSSCFHMGDQHQRYGGMGGTGPCHVRIVVILTLLYAQLYIMLGSTTTTRSSITSNDNGPIDRVILTNTGEIPKPLSTLVPVKTEGNIITNTSSQSTSIISSELLGMPHRPPLGTKLTISETSKVLVVYSGPTELVKPDVLKLSAIDTKAELYRLNFEYFLRYGVQCQTQDTVIVVTSSVRRHYQARVDRMNSYCQEQYGHGVIMAIRNSTCRDLETVRRVMHDHDIVDVTQYDYFVFVNCGLTGPSRQWADLPWTDVFLRGLNDQIKMTGLTLYCGTGVPHLQSMVYALDRQGIQIIRESDAIFDCKKELQNDHVLQARTHRDDLDKEDDLIINRYETGLGRVLLAKGFGIAPIVRPTTVFTESTNECVANPDYREDIWIRSQLRKEFGRLPRLDEMIFFKSSRVLPDEIANEINFTLPVTWEWT